MFSNLTMAWSWVEGLTNLEKSPDPTKRSYRLDRMKALLEAFNSPHLKIPCFHIAGSKGKGSTATFLAEILKGEGNRVGLYTSPHLTRYEERITMAGTPFDSQDYLWGINQIYDLIHNISSELDKLGGPATTFEVLTLLAFLIFVKNKMNYVVLETGLGGRLDATNLVMPIASIITRIELEHQDILGPDLTSIAGEKAGIIKNLCPVFSSFQEQEVLSVLKTKSIALSAPFYYLPEIIKIDSSKIDLTGTKVMATWLHSGDNVTFKIGAIGEVQGQNACLCLLTLKTLGIIGDLQKSPGVKSLIKVQIPGRFQILPGPIVLDGAHTVHSVRSAGTTFQRLFGDNGTLIFGAFDGKDIESMAKILGPLVTRVLITAPGLFRSSHPDQIAQYFKTVNQSVQVFPTPKDALVAAKLLGNPILVCGSFYLVGEIIKALELTN